MFVQNQDGETGDMSVDDSVTQFVEDHRLIHPGMRLVAGVSGGADSMALIQYLSGIRERFSLELAVCSVDHRLRGDAGKEDLAFVASWCRGRDIVFFGRTVDVPAYMKKYGSSLEAAARELRYRAFADVIHHFAADALVLAHHGDDQIETMLMQQVKGGVGPARAGIPVSRPFAGVVLIRPFLTQTKTDLEAYCRNHGIDPRTDETNRSDEQMRNRFRKKVLPFLKEENPSVHLKFQYASERIAEDEDFLQQLAEKHLAEMMIDKKEDTVRLSVPRLLAVPVPLQRRIIHLILNYLYKSQQMRPCHQSIHIDQLLHLVHSGHSSGRIMLPKAISAVKSYEICRIGLLSDRMNTYDLRISIPGRTHVPAGTITAEFLPGKETGDPESGSDRMIIDYRVSVLPLRVRTWKPGDRMQPAGMDGTQKVQRIFINKKIDRMRRRVWPLVVDGHDRVVWLPMLRHGCIPDPDPANREGQANYLLLTFKPTDDFRRTEA